MLATSGSAGDKKTPGPICGNFKYFPMNQKHNVLMIFCQFSLVGQCALFTRFGIMCWYFPNRACDEGF